MKVEIVKKDLLKVIHFISIKLVASILLKSIGVEGASSDELVLIVAVLVDGAQTTELPWRRKSVNVGEKPAALATRVAWGPVLAERCIMDETTAHHFFSALRSRSLNGWRQILYRGRHAHS